MEGNDIFHKGYAFSFDRMGDDGCGLAFMGSCFVEGCEYFLEIMTVDFDCMKAESPPFFSDIQHVLDLFCLGVILQSVYIRDGC